MRGHPPVFVQAGPWIMMNAFDGSFRRIGTSLSRNLHCGCMAIRILGFNYNFPKPSLFSDNIQTWNYFSLHLCGHYGSKSCTRREVLRFRFPGSSSVTSARMGPLMRRNACKVLMRSLTLHLPPHHPRVHTDNMFGGSAVQNYFLSAPLEQYRLVISYLRSCVQFRPVRPPHCEFIACRLRLLSPCLWIYSESHEKKRSPQVRKKTYHRMKPLVHLPFNDPKREYPCHVPCSCTLRSHVNCSVAFLQSSKVFFKYFDSTSYRTAESGPSGISNGLLLECSW